MSDHHSLNSLAHAEDAARLQELLTEVDVIGFSDLPRSETLLQAAVKLAQQLGDTAGEAQATVLLGVSFAMRAQFSEALDLFRQAEVLAKEAGEAALLARIANNIGLCMLSLGEYGQAMEHYQHSLSLARSLDDKEAQARVLNNIGLIYVEFDDDKAALEIYQNIMSLTADGSKAMRYIFLSAQLNTIRIYEQLGQCEKALTVAATILPEIQESNYLQHEIVLRVLRLPCLISSDQVEWALQEIQESLPLAEQLGDQENLMYLRLYHGKALMSLGALDEAQPLLQEALEMAKAHGLLPVQHKALSHLSQLKAAQNNWPMAYDLLVESHQLDQKLRDQSLKRQAQVLNVQMKLEYLEREAEAERLRNLTLSQANATLEQAQQEMKYRATHDALTGLANRPGMLEELDRALEAGDIFGLLFIDLDSFKQINDSLGHQVGDELLKEVAQRIQHVVRSSDLVARMGGDEFIILVRDIQDASDAELVAHHILNRLIQPIQVSGYTLYVTASIGVAVSPWDGLDANTLQRHADIAMYRAKHNGKNSVQSFQLNMGAETVERVVVERDLRVAITAQQIVLHYQSQFDTRTGELAGFEALVRWQHPEKGLLFPDKFIEVAEESRLIVPLGGLILREACHQAAAWEANARGFTMSVNVSALQFMQHDFLQIVQDALSTSGLLPERLILELTESVFLEDHRAALAKMQQLEAIGVQFSLDDFGTGYSSLGMLKNLHFDILKIDPSFLRDEQTKPERTWGLVSFLIGMAHGLDMKVTAEGVETQEQYDILRGLGCDCIQGFLLGKPEPANVASRRLDG